VTERSSLDIVGRYRAASDGPETAPTAAGSSLIDIQADGQLSRSLACFGSYVLQETVERVVTVLSDSP
jgi:hypothetical protein